MDDGKIDQKGTLMEALLRHMANKQEVMAKAIELRLKPEDFMISEFMGAPICREFAKAILSMKQAPVDPKLVVDQIQTCLNDGTLSPDDKELIERMYNYIFEDTSVYSVDYILEQLPGFIKDRRLTQIKFKYKDDLEKQALAVNALLAELKTVDCMSKVRITNPFAIITRRPDRSNVIQTGFGALDKVIQGHGKSELGFIFGYSGHCKTTTMMRMARFATEKGHKALVFSFEEPAENLHNRLYAAEFDLDYTKLHQNDDDEVQLARNSLDILEEGKRLEVANIRIIDALDMDPTPEAIGLTLQSYALNEGFYPDVVFIDQFSFLKPNRRNLSKNTQKWEIEELLSQDLHTLSKAKLKGQTGDEWPYALWVLHQVNGNPKLIFDRSDMAGFKGIIRPSTLTMGIGRSLLAPEKISMFSLKTRNTAEFTLTFQTDLQHMKILRESGKPLSREEAQKEPGWKKEVAKPVSPTEGMQLKPTT